MTLRVEALVDGVFIDLWDWAQHYAEREGIELADVVNCALDAERRRVERLPRRDPRTIKPGQMGATVQMRNGEITAAEMGRLTRATNNAKTGQIPRWRAEGLIETTRPTSQGVAAAFAHIDVVVCFVLVALELLVGTGDPRVGVVAKTVRDAFAVRESFRDVFVVVAGESVAAVTGARELGSAVATPTAVVYNLAAIEAELERRARG